MGGSIARGLVRSGFMPASDIAVSSPRNVTLDALSADCPGLQVSTDNSTVVQVADVIILAVKPWLIGKVLDEIAPRVAFREQIIVSLAAGVSLSDIDAMLHRYSSSRTLFRAIPNTAMLVGSGRHSCAATMLLRSRSTWLSRYLMHSVRPP